MTGFPEIMDGRVKTLHPAIHGGILGVRDDPDHVDAMNDHGIAPIDLVVVNLYPFEEVRLSGADYASIVENIDIGGPAMMRAAAKNHAYVAVVTDPDDYAAVLNALEHELRLACRSSSARSWRPRPSPAPPPMTPRSPAGWPKRWRSSIPSGAPSAAAWTTSCATARTRTRRPAST